MLKTPKLPKTRRVTGNGAAKAESADNPKLSIQITAPKMKTARFKIIGTAPLVIHRFSHKAKMELLRKMEQGSLSKKGKKREPLDPNQVFHDARYVSTEGWDGFNVASIRNGLISSCRLVGFKMVLAKLGVFCVAEGRDKIEPQYGLIRIRGSKAERVDDYARVETGSVYITIRPLYREWWANVTLKYDSDMFSLEDITNLLARMGEQVGIGEGRNDSKNSGGMGWGSFRLAEEGELDNEK